MNSTAGNNGFTIIETMLFLAITGLMVAGILVGSGVAIAQQRYRSSVNTLESFLQQQYNQTTNVVNDRSSTLSCTGSGSGLSFGTGSQVLGSSDCVILGRYIAIGTDGQTMTAGNVVGYDKSNTTAQTNNPLTELTTDYVIGLSSVGLTSQTVDWASTVVSPGTSAATSLAMLVVRSPLNGAVMTFVATGSNATSFLPTTQNNNNPSIIGLVSQNYQAQATVCVKPSGGAIMGSNMAIQIAANAATPNAIQIPSESSGLC